MFKVEIKTGNAAFEGNPEYEVKRILKEIEKKIEQGFSSGVCMDINGNKVGNWLLTK